MISLTRLITDADIHTDIHSTQITHGYMTIGGLMLAMVSRQVIRLKVIKNNALRTVLSAPVRTRISVLQVETEILALTEVNHMNPRQSH